LRGVGTCRPLGRARVGIGCCLPWIVNTRFLLRRLFPTFRSALKPGGPLLVETFSVDEIEVLGGDIRRDYGLERGELARELADFEMLLYED
jgi:hypothetical protein